MEFRNLTRGKDMSALDGSSKGLYLVTVALGIIGGLGFAVSLGYAEWSLFLSRAGLGFGVAWGLAYVTLRG